jgi:hypothetical protein
MTKKIVNNVKYIGLFAIILLSVIACERDFEDIGIGLVDNNQFSTKSAIFEVIAYNVDVETSRVDGLPEHLLGIYKDDNFGFIKTSFVSQLGLTDIVDFGDNPSIDAVVLDIPYYATSLDKVLIKNPENTDVNDSIPVPNYHLDSIIGNQETEYKLSVFESGTFLNLLDPADPTKGKIYYSDEEYNEKALLYSDEHFNPNRNDTVLYVNRNFLDDDINTVDDIDTIKTDNVTPSIKLPLDTNFFKNNFVNQQASGVFDSNDNFIDYFRGIIVKAEETSNKEGSLMTLKMSDANVTIYYTNTIFTLENGIDLNDNGTTDDVDVPIRTKQTMVFPMSGLRVSRYVRDYSSSNVESYISNSNRLNDGQDKLYLQGAAGSNAIIELFKGVASDSIESIREKNWLINEANLILYLDENAPSNTNVPKQLLLYRYDDNSQILDVFTEAGINGIGGLLERNDDNEPIKYKFRITDYISEVLKLEEPLNIEKLGLKVFHSSDAPNFQFGVTDTIIKDFSWNAKGVVLKGNDFPLTDAKRLKLEILYTINNE